MATQKSKGPSKAAGAAKSGPDQNPSMIDGKAEEVAKKKKSVSPFEFMQQVINEGRKVTWTSRNETLISTIMVLIMVTIMGIFFFAVDSIIRVGVCSILPIDCVSRDAF